MPHGLDLSGRLGELPFPPISQLISRSEFMAVPSKLRCLRPSEQSQEAFTLTTNVLREGSSKSSKSSKIFVPQSVNRLCAEVFPQVSALSPRGVCHALWALARARVTTSHRQSYAFAQMARKSLAKLSPQDFSNIVWAVAIIRCHDRGLVGDVKVHATREFQRFMPSHLALLSWSLTKLSSSRPFLEAVLFKWSDTNFRGVQGRDLVNVLWAFAQHQANDDLGLEALARQALSAELTAQGLANVVWASAVLTVDVDLRHLSQCGARAGELQMRDVSNIAWSLAILQAGVEDMVARGKHLLRAGGGDATAVLSLIWADAFCGPPDRELLRLAKKLLEKLGRRLDVQKGTGQLILTAAGVQKGPEVVLELADRLVIWKPSGWEVDQKAQCREDRQKLSSFVSMLFPSRQFPILADSSHQQGFLHRLDLPSSGLILAAKSYQAFYDLMLQLHCGALLRDYVVLCHGWVPPSTHRIQASIAWSDAAGSSSRSRTGQGKPSVTKLRLQAHLVRNKERFSLVAIRISTGRRHQIRAHLAHIGHPVVCDPKYGADEFSEEWCPRHFLHRYRLEFSAHGRTHVAGCGLPTELKNALAQLSPHTALLQAWLQDEMPGWSELPDIDMSELKEARSCSAKERMLVETDSPYLPVEGQVHPGSTQDLNLAAGHWLSHPGLIPTIVQKVAELKGAPLICTHCPPGLEPSLVGATLRENARSVYGF